MQFIAIEVFIYLYLFIFDYRSHFFIRIIDRACLRIAIPDIFRSFFGLLFCLLDRKLILRSKPI